MQKIATRIFITASIVFGVVGILMVMRGSFTEASSPYGFDETLYKLLMICVFVILPSFALSVASKYLKNGK